MLKVTTSLFILIACLNHSLAMEKKFRNWDEACTEAVDLVAEGDLIFLDIPFPLFRRVATATRSWTSHVGIVFKNPQGEWIVAESTIPFSRESSLCNFLQKSSEFNFGIRRLNRPLEVSEIEKLKTKASDLLHIPYTLGFDFDSRFLYCSKFVHIVYQSIGVDTGKIQTFRELLSENPEVSTDFWKVWFFGKIPWNRRTVTPASQWTDPNFHTILKGS